MHFNEIRFSHGGLKTAIRRSRRSLAARSALAVDDTGLLRDGLPQVAPCLGWGTARRRPVVISLNLEIASADGSLCTAAPIRRHFEILVLLGMRTHRQADHDGERPRRQAAPQYRRLPHAQHHERFLQRRNDGRRRRTFATAGAHWFLVEGHHTTDIASAVRRICVWPNRRPAAWTRDAHGDGVARSSGMRKRPFPGLKIKLFAAAFIGFTIL
ncbi:hypothetical protein F3P66_17220 [Agrobacterium fabrum]|uniref:Uncharacterized protein n=1 Tax=Agrobacterium fabrum (strain C58 / ATCC 33970) TaxID=176299 RepID=A9CFD0_AGRFC|nr:hypothetical protein Atu3540 [Agrobacterium fabrum str. C58]QKW99670.1 hypothetical protein GSF67_21445 [Agrobacterium sp. CGMCC 11546]QRM61194.1 hypothetical protein F3P66_17220 [Agrobacterium fabrum]TRB30116.1 hypothetical protein EXN51_10050 [Agrobacterium fabrum]